VFLARGSPGPRASNVDFRLAVAGLAPIQAAVEASPRKTDLSAFFMEVSLLLLLTSA